MSRKKETFEIDTGLAALCGGIFMTTLTGVSPLNSLMVAGGIGLFVYNTIEKIGSYKKLLENCGITNKDGVTPRFKKRKKTYFGYQLFFTLPMGINTDIVKKHKLTISQYLNKEIRIHYKHKQIVIDVLESTLDTYYEFKSIETKGALEIPLGYSLGNKLETIDISETYHILIAGETGSGKSTLLRSILTHLLISKASKNVELYLSDLKCGVELGIFEKCSQVKRFATNMVETHQMVYELVEEVRRRYKLFKKNSCVDFDEYNSKFKNRKLKYKVLVIEELAELRSKKETLELLISFAALARASGIFFIVATQRPCSKTIDSRIKANIPTTIGLKTATGINSRIVFDREGLEELRGEGHGFVKKKGKETEFQSMFLSPKQARKMLEPYYIKDEKVIDLKERKAEFKKIEKKANGKVSDFGFLKKLK